MNHLVRMLGAYLQQVKELSPVPVLAGFGISTPEHVQNATRYCDGVIVGSKIVDSLENNRKEDIIALIQASKTIVSKISIRTAILKGKIH